MLSIKKICNQLGVRVPTQEEFNCSEPNHLQELNLRPSTFNQQEPYENLFANRINYGKFTLPEGIYPVNSLLTRPGIVPVEGYSERIPWELTGLLYQKHGISAAASAEILIDLYKELTGLLGNSVKVEFQDCSVPKDNEGKITVHTRDYVQNETLNEHISKYADLLLNDPKLGLVVSREKDEIVLHPTKTITICAADLQPFIGILHEAGIKKCPHLKFIDEGNFHWNLRENTPLAVESFCDDLGLESIQIEPKKFAAAEQ
jgi:hypothetical protein